MALEMLHNRHKHIISLRVTLIIVLIWLSTQYFSSLSKNFRLLKFNELFISSIYASGLVIMLEELQKNDDSNVHTQSVVSMIGFH